MRATSSSQTSSVFRKVRGRRPNTPSMRPRCSRTCARNSAGSVDDHAADQNLEQELVFAGLLGMIDPPRAEAQEAVSRVKAGTEALAGSGTT